MNIKPWTEITEILPPLGSEERAELAQSIETDGLQSPILVLPDGRIIDGHHRWQITNGTAAHKVLDIPEWQAFDLAIKLNLARRQLTLPQRHEIQKKRDEITQRKKEEARRLRDEEGKTQAEAAKAVGVTQQAISTWEDITNTSNEDDCISYKKPDYRVKIPREQHVVIFERAEEGETQAQIAADYGVTQPRVNTIIAKERKRRQREAKRQEKIKARPGVSEAFTLIHGDMFTVDLPTDIDLVLTDFPYNISGEGKFTKLGSEAASFNAGEWDLDFDTSAAIKRLTQVLRLGGALVFFTDRAAISQMWQECQRVGLEPKSIIVWHKTNPVPNARRNFMSATEFILWAVKPGAEYTWNGEATTHNLFNCPICGGNERLGHPTQKPLALMRWLLNLFSDHNDIVLDPCAGVGSTGATDLVRQYYLIEKEKDSFDKMTMRLNK